MRDGFISVAAGTPKIRVADCRYNAEQIFTLMREAAKQGVKVLCLPELCITGYTCGDLFFQDTLLKGAEDAPGVVKLRVPGKTAGKLRAAAGLLALVLGVSLVLLLLQLKRSVSAMQNS